MTSFVLHIGRHKTGTSSLQHFLAAHRERLLEQGWLYPRAGLRPVAHHDIARFTHLRQRQQLPAAERERLARTMRALRAEVERAAPRVLLSSEAFQNCQPQWVAEHFSPGHTRIVVYIREQVDYLVSSYQQKVHATDYARSLDEYLEQVAIDYDAFLERWENVFGAGSVEARAYGRDRLCGGDIVVDFAQVLGLDLAAGFASAGDDRNPSIGGALLELKRCLNHCGAHARTPVAVYEALSRAAAVDAALRRKPLADAALAERIRRNAEPGNRRVFERHFGGDDVFAGSSGAAPARTAPPSTDELRALLAALLDQAPAVRAMLQRGGVVDPVAAYGRHLQCNRYPIG